MLERGRRGSWGQEEVRGLGRGRRRVRGSRRGGELHGFREVGRGRDRDGGSGEGEKEGAGNLERGMGRKRVRKVEEAKEDGRGEADRGKKRRGEELERVRR